MRHERYLTLATGCFVGAAIGYSHTSSTSYALTMAGLVTVAFVGIRLAVDLAADFATSAWRDIIRRPSNTKGER